MAIEDLKTIDQIKTLMGEGVKTAILRDVAGRPDTIYEANINASIGDPCLKTSFKYVDGAVGTSRKVIAYEESIVAWAGYEAIQAGAGNDFDLVL